MSGDESPVEVGGVRCLKVTFVRCSPALQAEKAAAALANAPPEVRAAGRAEIVAVLRAAAPTASHAAVSRIISKLNLPDEPIAHTEEHVQQARELMVSALSECAVCIVDAVEFFEKFVADVYRSTDPRGRLAYRLIIRAGDGEEFQIILHPSDFRGRGKSKKVKIPEALNDILRVRFGVEIDGKSAGDLLALIEIHAKPEALHEEIVLKTALRQLLRSPRLPSLSYYGLWCRNGLLYVPAHLAAEVIDALAHQFGNRFAFTKLCKKFGLSAEPHYKYYTPRDFSCKTENCARAYVFDAARLAQFLELPLEAICGSQL
ncbi:MAG: hypothetical protein LM577_07900 [Thermoproteaceae archaeon]|nr:hypothetical protein [Thermoproteaceae archaeon]